MNTLLQLEVPRFSPAKHIRNVERGEWLPCFDEDGLRLAGIRGRAGAADSLHDGNEFGSDLIEMAPGSAFPLHVHDGAHILYVLGGRGAVHIDAAIHRLRRGDTIFIPAAYPHAVSNYDRQAGTFTFLAVGIPHKPVDAPDRMRLVREAQSDV